MSLEGLRIDLSERQQPEALAHIDPMTLRQLLQESCGAAANGGESSSQWSRGVGRPKLGLTFRAGKSEL